MNNLLFIGLNGFAGSGKDTVAKILKTILGHNWSSLQDCKDYYNKLYTNPTWTSTYHTKDLDEDNDKVLCIAYADQLKMVCSSIFGIPFERFYGNKSNAWICVTDKFQYTEIKPPSPCIITADEYHYGKDSYMNSSDEYWMSLREILVYVGTYVLQMSLNKNIFVNIVHNKILEIVEQNPNLKYVIITDNRFLHEIEYIRENSGITINIIREQIEQLDNIAEHELDDLDSFDFILDNSKGYDELFENVWNLVHENIVFKNNTVDLYTRDNIHNYLRLVDNNKWLVCTPKQIQRIHNEGDVIKLIDLTGGPEICINEYLEIIFNNEMKRLFINRIIFDEETNYIYLES